MVAVNCLKICIILDSGVIKTLQCLIRDALIYFFSSNNNTDLLALEYQCFCNKLEFEFF